MHIFWTDVVGVIIVLGTLVLVHEWGHFATAKLFGVRVEVFSLGFGKRLFGFKRGGTDYRLSLLPLGGYVRMSGENPMEESTGDPGEFMSHPRWQRFIIAAAGPVMNIVLAVAVLTGVFMVHYAHPYFLDQPAVIGWVPENSPAAKAGLRPGDRIVQIDDLKNPVWEQAMLRELISAGRPLSLLVERGNQVFPATVTPAATGDDGHGDAGWDPAATQVEVEPGMPAAKAGILTSDDIVGFNGQPIHSMATLRQLLQENKDKPAEIKVLRQGQELKFTVAPILASGGAEKYYRIGVAILQHVDTLSFTGALGRSIHQNVEYSKLMGTVIKMMAERKVSLKQMAGPIGIGQASGEALRQPGWLPLLSLLSLLSINLGLFNLLPIPILDGGLILLLIIESVMRRDIKREIKERVYQAAFVFLIIFAAVVIYNDLTKTALGKFLP
jgi:regulator of sigma E protease